MIGLLRDRGKSSLSCAPGNETASGWRSIEGGVDPRCRGPVPFDVEPARWRPSCPQPRPSGSLEQPPTSPGLPGKALLEWFGDRSTSQSARRERERHDARISTSESSRGGL